MARGESARLPTAPPPALGLPAGDDYGWILGQFALLGRTDIVRALIDSGMHVDTRGWSNFTPLDQAAMHGRSETVQMLIEGGADLHDRAFDSEGPTPLDCALWGMQNNRAEDGDYPGTVRALLAAVHQRSILDRPATTTSTRCWPTTRPPSDGPGKRGHLAPTRSDRRGGVAMTTAARLPNLCTSSRPGPGLSSTRTRPDPLHLPAWRCRDRLRCAAEPLAPGGNSSGRPIAAHVPTHAHLDHIGSSTWLCRTFDIPLWCGAGDAARASRRVDQAADHWHDRDQRGS